MENAFTHFKNSVDVLLNHYSSIINPADGAGGNISKWFGFLECINFAKNEISSLYAISSDEQKQIDHYSEEVVSQIRKLCNNE